MSATWGRDSVNREHLYSDAVLRPGRVLDERVLERQRHQLCASVISSSAPAIWTPLASPVCGRTCDDHCRRQTAQGVDRIRYHICWGSLHGPHTTDLPLRNIVDVLVKVRMGAYSIEAGNVRHEHEWKVWRDVKLPDGKVLIPGVVSHATNVVEHPEVVADRILNFARVVGRENVIAGTDCGLGGRIHPQLVWAKLAALVEGAKLATKELYGS
jgi:hypothetical protein